MKARQASTLFGPVDLVTANLHQMEA